MYKLNINSLNINNLNNKFSKYFNIIIVFVFLISCNDNNEHNQINTTAKFKCSVSIGNLLSVNNDIEEIVASLKLTCDSNELYNNDKSFNSIGNTSFNISKEVSGECNFILEIKKDNLILVKAEALEIFISFLDSEFIIDKESSIIDYPDNDDDGYSNYYELINNSIPTDPTNLPNGYYCKPDRRVCIDNNKKETCSSDGSKWQSGGSCDFGLTCNNGDCEGTISLKTDSIINIMGSVTDFDVVDDYIYISDSSDNYLHIFDMATRSNPIRKCREKVGSVYRIKVVDNYAYLAAFEGLYVIDVYDPENINIFGPFEYDNESNIKALHVSGNYAYVVVFDTELYIFNISNPQSAFKVSSYDDGKDFTTASDVFVKGNYAYLAKNDGISIINISDPSNPYEESNNTTSSSKIDNLYIYENHLFASESSTTDDYNLLIYDISSPTFPVLEVSQNFAKKIKSIYIQNNYAFLTHYIGGFSINDIFDYNNIHYLPKSSENSILSPGKIIVDGNYIYANDSSELFNLYIE